MGDALHPFAPAFYFGQWLCVFAGLYLDTIYSKLNFGGDSWVTAIPYQASGFRQAHPRRCWPGSALEQQLGGDLRGRRYSTSAAASPASSVRSASRQLARACCNGSIRCSDFACATSSHRIGGGHYAATSAALGWVASSPGRRSLPTTALGISTVPQDRSRHRIPCLGGQLQHRVGQRLRVAEHRRVWTDDRCQLPVLKAAQRKRVAGHPGK